MAPAALTAVRVKLVSDRGIFYPRAALEQGTIGCVRLHLFLGAAGHPLVISDVDSHPPGVFDAAALAAATTFRYRITDPAGHAIPADAIPDVSVEQSLVYVLREEEDQADLARKWVCSLPPPRTLIVRGVPAGTSATIEITHRGTSAEKRLLSSAVGAEKTVPVARSLPPNDLVVMPLPIGTSMRGGWVTVRFCIDARGRVRQPWVTDSDPPGLYDQAAIAALSTWKFAPLKIDGEGVKTCRLSYTIPVIARSDLARAPAAVQAATTIVNLRYDRNGERQTGSVHGGKVTARFCVEVDGSLTQIQVLDPKPSRLLAAATVDVLESFQYWPRQVNGAWVRTCNIEQTLRFSGGRNFLSVHG